MLRSSMIPTMTAALLLSACATTGSGPSSTGNTSLVALQAGDWRVEDIAGAGVIDGSSPTLLFGPDGRLSGNASCNRLIGSYSTEGGRLTIASTGMTRMACPPALMEQERKLVETIATVTGYTIDEAGTLTLMTGSDKRIIARR